MAAAISGSACARLAVKNESGAGAVLALLEGGVISEISPLPQALRGGGRLSAKSGNGARRIAYRTVPAKHLRCAPHSYARYGGNRGLQTPPLGSLPRCGKTLRFVDQPHSGSPSLAIPAICALVSQTQ